MSLLLSSEANLFGLRKILKSINFWSIKLLLLSCKTFGENLLTNKDMSCSYFFKFFPEPRIKNYESSNESKLISFSLGVLLYIFSVKFTLFKSKDSLSRKLVESIKFTISDVSKLSS